MLIRALCDYALQQKESDIPDGWQEQGIHYRILLTPEGDVRDIVEAVPSDDFQASQKGSAKLAVQKIVVPLREKTTAVFPYYLDHRALYIFGIDYDSKNDKLIPASAKRDDPKKHPALVKHELVFFQDLTSAICVAYRRFLEKWNPEEMLEHPALVKIRKNLSNKNFGFALGIGCDCLENDKGFQKKYDEYWTSFKKNNAEISDTVSAPCGYFGSVKAIARKHDDIMGFPGGQPSGCKLICMKESAFESYGKKQSYNSNISEEAMKLYTSALNSLLADRRHYKKIGDLVILYFALRTDDSAECGWFSTFFTDSKSDAAQENYELDRLMQQVRQGRLDALPENGFDPDVTFYIAGLTPNATRLCQKFVVRDKFGNVIRNLAQHQQDLCIGENTRQISFSQIEKQLISPKSTNDKVSPPLMTALMLAALNGTRYPDGLLATAIRRIKTDSDEENNHFIKLNDTRAGIVKACLNRKVKKEEIKLAWDGTNQSPAYLCGALFAVYEMIQRKAATGDLNRTIKDAYFSSACSRPASIMPKLDRLSANHMKKLSEGSAIYYQKLLGSLMNGLEGAFPATLSLDDQGRFIIGYYHMNRRLWTAADKKEDTENV